MTVVIRPIGSIDIPALLRLVEEYWRFEDISGFDPARVTVELERLLADPALGSVWIASAGRDAAGYLLAVYVFSLEHLGLTAEIDEFFVLPSFRGREIGSKLSEDCRARIRPPPVHQRLTPARARKRKGADVLSATWLRRARGIRVAGQDAAARTMTTAKGDKMAKVKDTSVRSPRSRRGRAAIRRLPAVLRETRRSRARPPLHESSDFSARNRS